MALKDTPIVFVVDDDEGIRTSIKSLLESAGLRAECFETAEEFLQRKASGGPSCLILDVSLPGINGLDFQQQLRASGLQIPIIFLTAHGNIPMTVKAMKSGAVEFLTKPFGDEELLSAIQQALRRDSASRKEQAEIADLKVCYDTLTKREREVLNLISEGYSNKQGALRMQISPRTFESHRAEAMRKLGARNTADLVRAVLLQPLE